ncbi:hypothetical protein HHO41_20700 [Bacillus sp. DNRA2]|uniref:YkgJ family cysteine cluster protein n=1 Tax=Bacillus sp. DNRA2 TaxID=2723053 RepID=UPI00145CE815|nr:YkgJ family cysteine cluster protein [Bacillus sp. DNRA2]NMD72659.1 hypothetical protein [Bacillus sp. DNRA2]
MSRNNLCVCGSGKKQKRCHSDINPDSRAGKLLQIYSHVDEITKSFEYEKNHPCKKGCSSCCYHNFSITDIEFKLILRELSNWPMEDVFKLKEEIESITNIIQRNFPDFFLTLEKDGTGKSLDLMLKQTSNSTFDIPCPFLEVNKGTCKIYDTRPMICRLHGTTFYEKYEFTICENIPSNIENGKEVADVTSLKDEMDQTLIKFGDKVFMNRPYPIFYWFKIYFDSIGTRLSDGVSISNESRDFKLHSRIGERELIHSIFGKYPEQI